MKGGIDLRELKKEKMFCSICEEMHEVSLIEKEKETIIKGEKIKYKELYYKCQKYNDNNIFMTGDLWNLNLINSLDSYRNKKELLTSKEIKEIREKYGLSQSEMAFLLNLGEITITRYETKQIQDASVDNMIRELNDNPLFALKLLEKNKAKFKRYDEIEKSIKKVIDENIISFLNEQELIAKYVKFSNKSIENGNMVLDIDKLKNVVGYIAKKMNQVKKVVLMKLLWYIDALSYKNRDYSITGLVYTHMPYGALPIGHKEIIELASLKSNLFINENEYEEYKIKFNEKYKLKRLSNDEKKIIDEVLDKFKDYSSHEISDYMHEEKAYKETKDNEIIPFTFAKEINQI